MTSELLRSLFALTLASSGAALLTLGLRHPVRRLLGAAACCSMWLLVPSSMLAVLLPQLRASDATPVGPAPIVPPLPAVASVLHRSFVTGAAHPGAWLTWVIYAWIAGAAVLVSYFFTQQRSFVKSLGGVSGSRRVLRAKTCAGCPAVLGLLRPKLILPADFRVRYTSLERRLILSHERAHLRRGDLAWNAIVALLRCLFWFNPLAHLAAASFRADQELACDAAVMLRHPGLRRTYAAAMLKTQLGVSPALACSWDSADTLKERLRMLGRPIPSPARRTWGRACVALTCLAAGYTAWAAEPIEPPTDGVTRLTVTVTTGEPQASSANPMFLVLEIGGSKFLFPTVGSIKVQAAQMEALPGKVSLRGGVRIFFGRSAARLVVQADTAEADESPEGLENLYNLNVRFEEGCSLSLQYPSGQERRMSSGAKCSLYSYATRAPRGASVGG